MLNHKAITRITIVLLIIVLTAYFFIDSFSMYWSLVILTFWLLLTGLGSFFIRWNYYLEAIHKIKTTEKVIALTFDDGPNPIYTAQVLDLLKKYDAKASFFCIGKYCKQHPDLLNKIDKEGHVIGNHTFNHSNSFGFLDKEEVVKEITRTNAIIKKIIGKTPRYFRPPFGVTNPSVKKAISNTGHLVFGWNIRSLDTVIKDDKKVLKRIVLRAKPGSIILLHDVQENVIPVLEQLLIFLKQEKYKMVSLETLTNIKAYE